MAHIYNSLDVHVMFETHRGEVNRGVTGPLVLCVVVDLFIMMNIIF